MIHTILTTIVFQCDFEYCPQIYVYQRVAPGASYKANISRINVHTIYDTKNIAHIYPNKITN